VRIGVIQGVPIRRTRLSGRSKMYLDHRPSPMSQIAGSASVTGSRGWIQEPSTVHTQVCCDLVSCPEVARVVIDCDADP
jgi:hypothetical protein